MSEWSAPTGPTSSDYRTPQAGFGVLVAKLRKMESAIRALQQSAPLRSAGIFLADLGMRIASSLTVEGDLTSTGNADFAGSTHIGGDLDLAADGQVTGIFRSSNYVAGVSGWRLFPDGSVEFNGTLGVAGDAAFSGTLDVTGATTLGSTLDLSGTGTVTGNLQSSNFVAGVSGWRLTPTTAEVNTLIAKDAIIGNDALAAPVSGDVGNAQTGSVTVATTYGSFAGITFTVPAGFSRALVTANSAISFQMAAGGIGVEMSARIGGVDGVVMYAYGDNVTGLGAGPTNHARSFAVTPGGTFVVETRARGGGATATATISTVASVWYFRS